MKPSIGRIVHVFADPKVNNGADEAPAMITRAWNDHCVNVRVLLDGHGTNWVTSIPLYDTREEAQAAHDEMAAGSAVIPIRAWWPPRI